MIPKVSLSRLAVLLVAFVMVAGVLPLTAGAQVYKLSGNARFQIGDGLPVPIGATAAPNGKVGAKQTARVTVTTGGKISMPAGQLTHQNAPLTLPVLVLNSKVPQVRTNIGISFPGEDAVFSAGKRTGASVVTVCPGDVVAPAGNPGCPGGIDGGTIHGRVTYTATGAQFGGPAVGTGAATADVAIRVAGTPPCAAGPLCRVQMAYASPNEDGQIGAAFDAQGANTPALPVPSGHFEATIAANGAITGIGNVLGPGVSNAATTFGAPWTTGRITISVTKNAGTKQEVFILSGSDDRNNGVGSISLVSSSISARVSSGANANRGWLNLTISPVIPAMSTRGIAASVVLMILAGGYALRRWTRS